MSASFVETSRQATGQCQPAGSHMRGDGGNIIPRNSAIQLRAANLPGRCRRSHRLAAKKMTVHPFIQVLRDIACLFAAFLLVSVTGVGIAFAVFVLLFVSL